jgi:hypothetical protein
VRSQGAEVGGRGAGVRSQESGVRSQESGVRSQENIDQGLSVNFSHGKGTRVDALRHVDRMVSRRFVRTLKAINLDTRHFLFRLPELRSHLLEKAG